MSDNLFPAPERFERKHDTSQGTVVILGGGMVPGMSAVHKLCCWKALGSGSPMSAAALGCSWVQF